MITNIDFIQPKSIDQALKLLAENNLHNCILSGGTDVITGIQMQSKRFANIDRLIDINAIAKLKEINISNNHLVIGGNVTFSELRESVVINENLPLLVQAASGIGNTQIRNRATVAGNIANNAPCADSVPPLLVYNAFLKIDSSRGEREIPLQEFLIKAYKTQIAQDELITEIRMPMPEGYKGYFYKLGRRQSVAISRISLAVLAKLSDNKIKDIRIASGAVTPIGQRFNELENFACGKEASKELYIELAQKMAQQILDVTGLRWSGYYKIPVLQQTFYQLLLKTMLQHDFK